MTPEEIIKLENSIDKLKKFLDEGKCNNPEQAKGILSMMESTLKYNIETDEDRAKRRKETRRKAHARQKKRYNEKYYEYEKSWGGRYSDYQCLLRIDPNLFQ
jgi:hypothetical protein